MLALLRQIQKEQSMDDEDDDMIFSFLFVAITILAVTFVVGGVGLIIWSLTV